MNNNARTNGNPVAQLLQQALSLTQQQVGIPVLIDYESIARAVIKVMREEQKREDRNPERLLQQAEVYRRYGKEVILTLVRRGKLQKYRFDLVEKYDMGIVKEKEQAPIYMEPDSPMITTLREIYAENSGDYESRPRVIGGGTYARCAENIIAFGALFPGDEDRMHQKDRFDLVEKYDEEGNVVKYPKGYVYYRPAEIEAAIEENNLLKGVKNVEVD